MYKTYNNLSIDNFSDDSELFLDVDTECSDISFVDLALVEIKYPCNLIRLYRINYFTLAEGINSNYTWALWEVSTIYCIRLIFVI